MTIRFSEVTVIVKEGGPVEKNLRWGLCSDSFATAHTNMYLIYNRLVALARMFAVVPVSLLHPRHREASPEGLLFLVHTLLIHATCLPDPT